jgi:hypothetical protein
MQDHFKYFAGVRRKLHSGQEVFRNHLTGRPVIVDGDAVTAAALCNTFATLDEHVARIEALQKNGVSTGDCRSALQRAVQAGLLASYEQVRKAMMEGMASHAQPKMIDMVAIPTRNRPETLQRLLVSLAANLREFERNVTVLVIDDSESIQMQNANCQLIAAFASNPPLKIRYGNRDMRQRFAAKLARASGVPEQIVSFALAGGSEYPISTGATRNSILLQSTGHCVLCLDDDVLCRLAAIPGSTNDVTFGENKFATWFLPNAQAIDECKFVEEDLLSLHERLLNIDGTVVRNGRLQDGQLEIAGVSQRLLRRVAPGNAAVTVTVTGVVGDSTLDDPLAYFFTGPETFSRLIETEEIYRAALQNRLVLRGQGNYCITDQGECKSTCMGLDNLDLLPPFMPVMRNQDLVFGSLIIKCVPGALFGFIPRGILHLPSQQRELARGAAALRAGKLMTGESLGFLIGFAQIRGKSRQGLLQSLAVRLKELTSEEAADLEGLIRSAVEPILVLWIEQLDKIIESCSGSSSFWLKDVLELKAATLSALKERDYSVPWDLEQVFGPAEGQRHFYKLIGQFAALLHNWTAMVESARPLLEKGEGLCLPIRESRQVAMIG